MRFYNSLSREVEEFVPVLPGTVRMYVCGPTVYDTPHLGNVRPAIVFDVLYRLLRQSYTHVWYVRNITDIDDKIMERAAQNGETIETLTRRTILDYHRVLSLLNVAHVDIEPRATQTIPEMIAMIEGLLSKGHAYAAEGHVLFRVSSYSDHGLLSRHDQGDLRATGRVAPASYKEAEADFVLWKPSDASQPGWDSPWGRGRPGWHIECSAMIEKHLGHTIDIHGGGSDLRFPHHDCEMSQSFCVHGKPLSKYWMHNGMLLVNGKKMAKSAGNFFTVHDLLKRGAKPDAIRLAILQTHYRQPLNWTDANLELAALILERWKEALAPYRHVRSYGDSRPVLEALCDDLNTPAAITAIHELIGRINKNGSIEDVIAARSGLEMLGLLKEFMTDHLGDDADLFSERIAARAANDYVKSDELRAALRAKGIVVKDTATTSFWWRV